MYSFQRYWTQSIQNEFPVFNETTYWHGLSPKNSWVFLPITTLILSTVNKQSILYAALKSSLTIPQRRRIAAAQVKLMRPLAGYTLYDYKTNDYIRRELQITGILDKIDEYRQNWLQHLQRMPQNRFPLKSYYCRPQGKRTNGRPKKRWREQL